MPSESFLAENQRRRRVVNQGRQSLGRTRIANAKPAKPAAKKPEAKVAEKAVAAAEPPSRDKLLGQVNATLQGVALSQQQGLLTSGVPLPPPGSHADLQRKIDRWAKLVQPHWT